jgi:hypothetical protein
MKFTVLFFSFFKDLPFFSAQDYGLKDNLELKKKKINVLVKECFRAVLLKPVEGMRDRWAGRPPGLGSVNGSPGPLRGHMSRLRSFWEGCRNEPVLFPRNDKRTRKARS